ncbi:tetratricopeptide repeat protein [Planctomicrobium sp. SH661]|uniref:tetratricopeptide repeat protein n=1 Tax=Planctomicrobium sp. SH661 TaxID=3448124 RepID=UPI003F5C4368
MYRERSGMLLGLCLVFLAMPVLAQAPSELDKIKDQADTAYRERDFPKAMQLCDQALAIAPEDHVALYLRGSSRIEMGIFSGNVELIRTGIADAREAIRHEGKGKADYYLPYIYGMSHLSAFEGKPVHATTARTVADSVLDRDDITPEQRANLYYQRAQADLQLKDFPSAETDLQEAIKLAPQHLAAYMLTAEVAAKSKTPADAVNAYTNVVNAFPTNPLVYNNRGMYLQSQGRTKEALADFDKAIQLDPKLIPSYINRGFTLLEAGDPAGAEAALTQALTVDPSQLGAISLRATARLDQNKAAPALEDYRKVAQVAAQNPMAHADLGFAQFFTKDFQGALTSFRTALKLDPKLRFLLPWELACKMRLNQVDASAYADITGKPAETRDWFDQVVLFQLGQTDAANLLKSTSANDEAARASQLCEAYYFIGMELQRRGRDGDAVAYFKQATQKKLPKLSAYRGSVYALQNTTAPAQ